MVKKKLTKMFYNFLTNANDNLGKKRMWKGSRSRYKLHIYWSDIAIVKYKNHPSTMMINKIVSFESQLRFRDVIKNDL